MRRHIGLRRTPLVPPAGCMATPQQPSTYIRSNPKLESAVHILPASPLLSDHARMRLHRVHGPSKRINGCKCPISCLIRRVASVQLRHERQVGRARRRSLCPGVALDGQHRQAPGLRVSVSRNTQGLHEAINWAVNPESSEVGEDSSSG